MTPEQIKIDKQMFENITSLSCSYCGSSESMGLDRVNNNEGYISTNIVSCCSKCNMMKHILPVTDFKNHITKIGCL
jgi:hypothetical protein